MRAALDRITIGVALIATGAMAIFGLYKCGTTGLMVLLSIFSGGFVVILCWIAGDMVMEILKKKRGK